MMQFVTLPAAVSLEEVDAIIRFWADEIQRSAQATNGGLPGRYMIADASDRLRDMMELRAQFAEVTYSPGASPGTAMR